MRLHTDLLTAADVHKAIADLPGVYAEVTTHGSRKRRRALEVKLTGNSNRRPNYGSSRNADRFSDERAATWDEWGIMLGRLFDWDSSTTSPYYEDVDHFHWSTGDRFRTLAWADQHVSHRWSSQGVSVGGSYIVHGCECGAIRRYLQYGHEWADLS